MQFHKNEILLLFNPETSKGRQTKAFARTINKNIHEVNVIHERLGPTYWKEVVNMLRMEPKELMDRSHPDYQAKVAGKTITMHGWLDILFHNPHLLKAPIAIYSGRAVLCQTPTDIFKLGVSSQTMVSEKVLPHLRNAH